MDIIEKTSEKLSEARNEFMSLAIVKARTAASRLVGRHVTLREFSERGELQYHGEQIKVLFDQQVVLKGEFKIVNNGYTIRISFQYE